MVYKVVLDRDGEQHSTGNSFLGLRYLLHRIKSQFVSIIVDELCNLTSITRLWPPLQVPHCFPVHLNTSCCLKSLYFWTVCSNHSCSFMSVYVISTYLKNKPHARKNCRVNSLSTSFDWLK